MAACELAIAVGLVAEVPDKELGAAIPAVAGTKGMGVRGMGGGGLGLMGGGGIGGSGGVTTAERGLDWADVDALDVLDG